MGNIAGIFCLFQFNLLVSAAMKVWDSFGLRGDGGGEALGYILNRDA